MTTAQLLLALGSGIALLMGVGHGVLTLVDTIRPRYFTPVDDSVRIAMDGARRIRMQGRWPVGASSNVWRLWLGFNLSHSLGVIVPSGTVLAIALLHFQTFAESWAVKASVLVVTVAYLVTSIRFWFSAPTLGLSIVLGCFVGAAILA